MKIGILSDSHDNLPALDKAVQLFNDADVGLVIHAGDLVSPFVSRPLKNLKSEFVAVYGNNDGEKLGLYNVLKKRIHRPPFLMQAGSLKVLILHEPDQLKALKFSGQYDAIIYGHTHEAHVDKSGTLIINPGECGGWVNGRRTIALWNTENRDVQIIPV